MSNGLPAFQLHLKGSNVPLARRVEAIVRADLDLTVTNGGAQPALVLGSVRLRNSFYLQDLLALTPGGTAAPLRRPPYFRIEREPFASWRLNVALTGQRFLKLRTPLFNGEVSANLQLRDTLKDPMAVGEVKINAGTVRLPFATLPVTQGFITLSSANPYQPQLLVTAAARVFSYDVKMEVTGSADRPTIQFSSTPPLTSEQVLLMLTAGELPRGDFSFSTQQRAQTMALFLGRSVLSEFGVMGGDANRLTILSGETISEAGKPTYSVEYKLADKWSVIGEYDRFNDYNVMLKWRVFRR
jgi:translocation and assembly module TamB